jgi:hypothetical protein
MMLFAFFGFWGTTVLAGAGAISIPVIIHLLNRRRYKIVEWAAMRFLLKAQKQNTKRMRIEQLILLLVRMAMLGLIVFAMAAVMPWAETAWAKIWPQGGEKRPRGLVRTHHLLVLDGSLSMTAESDGQSAFTRAKNQAIERITSAPPGDGFSVLVLKDSPAWIVGEVSPDGRKVVREIEAIQASHGNATLPTALNMVAAKLVESGSRYPAQAVYFFTDMQKATWQGLPRPTEGEKEAEARKDEPARDVLDEIQKRAKWVYVDVGKTVDWNIGVSHLTMHAPYVVAGLTTPMSVSVSLYGKEPKKNVRLEILTGKARDANGGTPLSMRTVSLEVVDLAPGEKREVPFPVKFTEAGVHVVQVKVEGDSVPADNVASMVLTVRETIPVLLVNGKQAADPFDTATQYARIALNPFPKGAEPKFAPLRPRQIPQTKFADMQDQELQDIDCIFLSDVNQLGQAEQRRLETHVRRGGGLIVTLGDRAAENFHAYNTLLFKGDHGLLPGQLVKKVTAPADHHFTFNAQEDEYLVPPLLAFKDDKDRLTLRSGRFRSYVQVKLPEELRPRVVLSFMPELAPGAPKDAALDKDLPIGDPAILEWNPPSPKVEGPRGNPGGAKKGKQPLPRMRGKVILLTSTINLDWTSWPGSPSFGSMMQELVRLGVSGRLRDQAGTVGNALEEILPGSGAELDVTLSFPVADVKARKLKTRVADEVNVFRWTETDYAGIYMLTIAGSSQEIPFAINPPATTSDQTGSESDPTRATSDDIKEFAPGLQFQIVFDPKTAQLGGGPNEGNNGIQDERTPVGPEIAHWALILVLLLLFLESFLAWQFGHYTTVEGSVEEAKGLFWPGVLAALALFGVFVVGALLYYNYTTGDLLAAFPESGRTWAEGVLGIPPSAPGEATRIDLESQPVFPFVSREAWVRVGLAVFAGLMLFFLYKAEGPLVNPFYKMLMGCMRISLILLTLYVLMPQLQLRIDREGWPDIALIIDDSLSMGEPDVFQDEKVRAKAKVLGERVREKVKEQLPDKIKRAEEDIERMRPRVEQNANLKTDLEDLQKRLQTLKNQLAAIGSPNWRPTRLQLVQSLVSEPGKEWVDWLVENRRTKIHVYHLDAEGRAVKLSDEKGDAGEISDQRDPAQVLRAKKAIAAMDPAAKDSRLGTALRQVVDHYRGAALTAVVMFTDGVTTRDETIAQLSDYAAQKGVPLFFVGVGDDHEIRDLKLHDLQVEDVVYVNDRIVFEAKITGQGFKNLTVPIVLKVKEKDGREKEVGRTLVTLDPAGKAVKLRLQHQPTEVGRKPYIVQVELPKLDGVDKGLHPNNLRLERTIDVIDSKQIKVLYVEGQPRYEFRFLKFLLEREALDAKKNKSIDLKVVLTDADPDFAKTDRATLPVFPPTLAELSQFDVLIIGDVNPKDLGETNLKNIADYVRGKDAKGKELGKGSGLLMIAGPMYAPHSFKGTPLADVLPIEMVDRPNEPDLRKDKLRLDITPVGRMHPIFRLHADDGQNADVWGKMSPMFWHSGGYRIKPLAEVLAVHPTAKGLGGPGQGADARLPLAVQQFVGGGRTMFFGFDETWRWRFRDDEPKFNQFWIQTMRYLARGRITRTDLRLDKQTPYRQGEPIKVSVRFPEDKPIPGLPEGRPGPKTEVKVMVEYRPNTKQDGPVEAEVQTVQLAKLEGSSVQFEGTLQRTREGKYRIRLMTPDVSSIQPDGEKPSAEAVVEMPPGELDKIRMNQGELMQAADATQGKFYTLAGADDLLEDLPPGVRLSLNAPRPPIVLWNHWFVFLLAVFLASSEWVLRKRKHLA